MFKVNQKVWCAIYGAGVVTEVADDDECFEHTFSVCVKFKNNDDHFNISYTSDGKYCADSSIVLFPYPIEITKAISKPSIDWSHVDSTFRYLMMDERGQHWLTTNRPTIPATPERWVCGGVAQSAGQFASLIPGTCNWRDSLVKRPN